MTVLRVALVIGLVLASGPLATAVADDGAIIGLWLTAASDDGRSHVEIQAAGESFSGRIVWLEKPTYPPDDDEGMGGQKRIDRKNPDAELKERPILGLEILSGFEDAGDGLWQGGEIYDPSNGKTYRCKMRLEGETLRVRGFVGFSLLGRTTEWTRVEAAE